MLDEDDYDDAPEIADLYTADEVRAELERATTEAFLKGRAAERESITSLFEFAVTANGNGAHLLTALKGMRPLAKAFDPSEPRDDKGEWTSGADDTDLHTPTDDIATDLLAVAVEVAEQALQSGEHAQDILDDLHALTPEEAEQIASGTVEKAVQWQEHLHPRSKNGRFISLDRIDAARRNPDKADALRKEVKPEDRKKLEDALSEKTDVGRTKRGQERHDARQARIEAGKQIKADRDKARAIRDRLMLQAQRGEPLDPALLTSLIPHLSTMTGAELAGVRLMLSHAGASFGGARKVGERRARLLAWARDEEYKATSAEVPKNALFSGARRNAIQEDKGQAAMAAAVAREGKEKKPKQKKLNRVDTVLAKVRDFGGIDPTSHDLLKTYESMTRAVQDGIPLAMFKKGGRSLDQMAQELEESGYIKVPENKDASEYVLDLIRDRANTLAADQTKEYDDALLAYQRAEQDAADYAEAGEIERARSSGEAAGHRAGAQDLLGEHGEGAGGSQAEGVDALDDDFLKWFASDSDGPAPAAPAPISKPAESTGFTGTDAHGHHWADGEQVKQPDAAETVAARTSGGPSGAAQPHDTTPSVSDSDDRLTFPGKRGSGDIQHEGTPLRSGDLLLHRDRGTGKEALVEVAHAHHEWNSGGSSQGVVNVRSGIKPNLDGFARAPNETTLSDMRRATADDVKRLAKQAGIEQIPKEYLDPQRLGAETGSAPASDPIATAKAARAAHDALVAQAKPLADAFNAAKPGSAAHKKVGKQLDALDPQIAASKATLDAAHEALADHNGHHYAVHSVEGPSETPHTTKLRERYTRLLAEAKDELARAFPEAARTGVRPTHGQGYDDRLRVVQGHEKNLADLGPAPSNAPRVVSTHASLADARAAQAREADRVFRGDARVDHGTDLANEYGEPEGVAHSRGGGGREVWIEKVPRTAKKGFDPNEPRDAKGEWATGGSGDDQAPAPPDEARKAAAGAAKQWEKSLDSDEREAVTDYTLESDRLNYALRNGMLNRHTEEAMDYIDAALEKSEIPVYMTVFRGLDHDPGWEVDDEQSDAAYLSVSTGRGTAEEFAGDSGAVIEMAIPKGAKGAYIAGLSPSYANEGEILLPRDTPFRVAGKRQEDGRTVYRVELMPQE